ncbi:MAG TPA: ABC transporter transmembrane domain-containing protein, partial [Chloroflexota bacterium]
MKYIPRLLPYLRPHWRLALLSLGVLVLASLATLLTPWPLTLLVDNVLGGKPLPPTVASVLGGLAANQPVLLILAACAGLVITLLSGGLDVLSNYVNTRINQRIVFSFRSDLLRQTQLLSVPFADQVSTGRLMYAINFEAVASGGVITAMEPLIQGAFTIVGMVAISFRIDPLLALLSILVVPPLYYSVSFYARHIQPRLLHVKQMEADSLSIIHDTLSMLRVTVAFVRETYEVHRFQRQGERTVDARVNVTVRQAAFGLAVSLITAAGNALVLGFGAWHVMQGQLTTGQLLVVLSYVAAVYKPLQAISTTIGALQDQFVGLGMGFHVLDTRPVVEDSPNARSIDRARGQISFEHVSFNYPGRAETL